MKRSPLKRSSFKRKVNATQTSLAHVQGKRRDGRTVLSGRARLNRFGKKAKLREKINRPNRALFRELGLLDVCEAALPGCWPDGRKTWSHGRKDRKLTMDERKHLVIRACTCCHRKLDEEMSPEELLAFHQNVIANRQLSV